MLAWGEFHGASEEEGYAESVAWERLDLGGCAVAANIAIEEGGEAEETLVMVSVMMVIEGLGIVYLDHPDGDHGFDVIMLGWNVLIKMDPERGQD